MNINERAGRYAPDYFYLYDKRMGLANLSASELFGMRLKSEVKNPIDLQYKTPFILRPYQEIPINELLQKSYGLLYAYVARGKTACSGEIIKRIWWRAVILCNTKVNATQCRDRLAEFFGEDKVGMFYSEKKEFKEITVVVYPSYGKFLELYNWQFDTLIIDECDLFLSDDMRLWTIYTKAQYKYWLTGTPYNETFKQEDMQLRRGRIIEAKEYNTSLINQFNFNFYGVEAWSKVTEYKDYHDLKKQVNKQADKMQALQRCVTQWLQKWTRVLVLCDTKVFTKKITEELWYIHMTWEDNKKSRAKKFSDYNNEKVLCATYQIVWRWYDNPEVDVVVLAFSWRSEAPIIQAIGRWLRSLPWKKDVYIYDIFSPSWIMMNQRRQRQKYYMRFTDQINKIKFTAEEEL